MRVAAAAFVAAAIFLGGVMVGLGSGGDGGREAPVAIALVDEGTTATPNATPQDQDESSVKNVEHPAKHGEVDDNSGPGGGKAEYWEEEADEDNSGPGSGDDSTSDSSGPGSGDDSSGSGSGGDDNSGSGSTSSGSGSDGSGDSSGPG